MDGRQSLDGRRPQCRHPAIVSNGGTATINSSGLSTPLYPDPGLKLAQSASST